MRLTLISQSLLALSLLLTLSGCDSSSESSNSSSNSSSNNSNGVNITTNDTQVKDFTDAKIEEMCRAQIEGLVPILSRTSCILVAALSSSDENTDCVTETTACFEALPDLDIANYDLDQECTRETEGSPHCVYAACKESLATQKMNMCTATDTLLVQCLNDSRSEIENFTADKLCMDISQGGEDTGMEPASCQEIERLCPSPETETDDINTNETNETNENE